MVGVNGHKFIPTLNWNSGGADDTSSFAFKWFSDEISGFIQVASRANRTRTRMLLEEKNKEETAKNIARACKKRKKL